MADEPVIVVSGLPRSGTSLLMQMLAAADVPVLSDDARSPDESNPRGYFELAAVKAIRRSTAFLDAAAGRAVKVVAPLLTELPKGRAYRVVFVHRPLDQVLRSQAAMLERQGADTSEVDEARLARAFAASIEAARAWVEATPGASQLDVDHADLLERPSREAERIARFLDLDPADAVARMAAVVDPALHRAR